MHVQTSNIQTLKIVVPYLITNIGHEADPGFLAVSPQVTLDGHTQTHSP